MSQKLPISRVVNLISEGSQRVWTTDESEGRRRLLASDIGEVLDLDGSFALVAQDGERVVLARGLDRPMPPGDGEGAVVLIPNRRAYG